MYLNVRVSRHSKEELALAIDKRLQVIDYKILFKKVSYATKKTKNKDILNLKQYCAMWPLVTHSN